MRNHPVIRTFSLWCLSGLGLILAAAFLMIGSAKAAGQSILDASNYHIVGGRVLTPVKKGGTESAEGSVLHDNRLDRIYLGTSIKELFGLYPSNRIQRVLVYDAHRSYQKFEVLNKERTQVLFTIDPACSLNDSACVVRRIIVKSSSYRTPSNLRVGKYYIDLMHSASKVSEVVWYEGNLVARAKKSGISYVLQTNSIPRLWYDTMDKEIIPDSTRIIGIMITGKSLDGVSYQLADSLMKKKLIAVLSKIKKAKSKVTAIKTRIDSSARTENPASPDAGVLLESSPDVKRPAPNVRENLK